MMAHTPGVMRMADVGRELVASLYETVLTIRRFEQRGIEQYRLGNIRGYYHPYLGEEAIAAGGSGPCGLTTTLSARIAVTATPSPRATIRG